jgi:hypothetical protein
MVVSDQLQGLATLPLLPKKDKRKIAPTGNESQLSSTYAGTYSLSYLVFYNVVLVTGYFSCGLWF